MLGISASKMYCSMEEKNEIIKKLENENKNLKETISKLMCCQNCEYGSRFSNVDPCKECHSEGMYINWTMEIKK